MNDMKDKKENIKKIPYGISDYEKIVKGNYYYVDKTLYLKTIEEAGDYLFFIRPRRFGKSLFVSLMETYYDVSKKDQFEFFYKDTKIFQKPTKERNSYLVLKFNFSAVNPDIDYVEQSFFDYVLEVGEGFISNYHHLLDIDKKERIKELKSKKTGPDVLRFLIWLCRQSGQKLFVIIDEYDNFSNTILTTAGSADYQKLTHGEGFFRSFFNMLKEGTSGSAAPISRLFLTGVSPITLDDVTSGYNIGENVSLAPEFNRMLGFTGPDVREILDYYKSAGLVKHETEYVMEIMNEWYGNYLFSKYSEAEERLYNSDMILYFLKQYFRIKTIPDDLIDRNVRIDYNKLRHLIIIDSGKTKIANGNFNKLREIIERGEISSKLVKGFPLEELVDTDNFISLLFYFGLLTIESAEKDIMRLKVPNETMKRLYYDYIKKGFQETEVFDLDLSRYSKLTSDMAYDGKWEPLFKFITGRMRESMSLRDLITGEKSIQAFLNVYLGLSSLYIIHTEKELSEGYADIVMEPFLAGYEGIQYSYILEIKYIKKSDAADPKALSGKIQQLKREAEAQLQKYTMDEKFKKTIGKTTLIKLVLIFTGSELNDIGQAS